MHKAELKFMQAIAAMLRAQEADSTNLEVLLALGVSHTNGKWLFAVPLLYLTIDNFLGII